MVEEMGIPASNVATVIDGVHTDFFADQAANKT